ncbi:MULTISPECIES: hypothetical protein [unclassified Rhodococcus (in: high G+C Gram-positive bacteria)]|jgi:hypothetical protein|uniref:hypothetical protein n=1 Tax=unclassified Rhodococcus (in: high G+C Gram-positive bacteria) TaxID=192944 RepID=UPI001AD89CBF|nr:MULTISPECIES: hypothetical protein [unclassified Rhodococcus (in: high G+C Gram-positive bacteria)]QTJ66169.1 hypothetical protein HYG77_11560 [Rhodococcus sp. ZPP]
MNGFVLRTVIAAAAITVALGTGVASAGPTLHGDPATPGTQLNVRSNDQHSYSCGTIGVTGGGVGTAPPNSIGQSNSVFFGSGPVQGGCVGSDGSVHFPSGHAH